VRVTPEVRQKLNLTRAYGPARTESGPRKPPHALRAHCTTAHRWYLASKDSPFNPPSPHRSPHCILGLCYRSLLPFINKKIKKKFHELPEIAHCAILHAVMKAAAIWTAP